MISDCRNMDCMDFMKEFPDRYFDLAIVDPPYGIGIMSLTYTSAGGEKTHAESSNWKSYDVKKWDDIAPDEKYFEELFRVSKNQIVCGGNYFSIHLPISRGWIVWNKVQRDLTMGDGELLYTSFSKVIRIYDGSRNFSLQEDRMHPTQKPIKLYRWLLKNYAKPGDKILDTHLGSGSSRIAAYKLGFDFWATELDKDYFEAQEERFKKAIHEPLFQTQPEVKQKGIFE